MIREEARFVRVAVGPLGRILGDMDRKALVQVFDQIIEGYDIPTPEAALKIKQESAQRQAEGLPYSVLKNLAHAVTWQAFWLRKLGGGRKKSGMPEWKANWRDPGPEEWEPLRLEFISGLKEARRIASSEPFDHKCESDEEAVDTLIRIAVHGTYHIGQIYLLRRSVSGRIASGGS